MNEIAAGSSHHKTSSGGSRMSTEDASTHAVNWALVLVETGMAMSAHGHVCAEGPAGSALALITGGDAGVMLQARRLELNVLTRMWSWEQLYSSTFNQGMCVQGGSGKDKLRVAFSSLNPLPFSFFL